MIKLSSGLTVLFKFVIPVFWVVFFGSFIAAFLFLADGSIHVGSTYFKGLLIAGYIGWCILMYFTIFKLKRVEGSKDGLFISNYFKHIQVPFEAIRDFSETHLGLFILIKVRFNQPTFFGKKVYFLASPKRFSLFVNQNADLLQ